MYIKKKNEIFIIDERKTLKMLTVQKYGKTITIDGKNMSSLIPKNVIPSVNQSEKKTGKLPK